MSRKNILTDLLKKSEEDSFLISDPYSLRYYTDFRGGEGFAFCSAQKQVLIVDSRYTEAAEKESDWTVIEFNAARPVSAIVCDIVQSERLISVGYEDEHMTCAAFGRIKEKINSTLSEMNGKTSELIWKPVGKLLLGPRQVKDQEEIKLLREAEHIGDAAFKDILGILKPGMTELEVAAELEYSMKKHGASGLSFDTIAASGINSSMPHAIPTEKCLETGDFLTMDFGCIYQGYCSDIARTVVIGKASDEQKEIYNIVLEAQLKVLENVRPGMVCKEVDAIARDHIRNSGYGDYFGHGLGHSVGLYIHESPAFNTRDESVLEPGMVITDEPGIYLPGKFGVRIEDMILITEDGFENLAASPKELIEL